MIESAQAFVWGLVCLSVVWASGAAVASFCEAIGEDTQNESRTD